MEIKLYHFCLKPSNLHPLTVKILARKFLRDPASLFSDCIAYPFVPTLVLFVNSGFPTVTKIYHCHIHPGDHIFVVCLQSSSFTYSLSHILCIIQLLWEFFFLTCLLKYLLLYLTLPLHPVTLLIIVLSIIVIYILF